MMTATPFIEDETNVVEMNIAQMWSLYRKYLQSPDGAKNFWVFMSRAQATWLMDGAIVLPWCRMALVIETDGYCHS